MGVGSGSGRASAEAKDVAASTADRAKVERRMIRDSVSGDRLKVYERKDYVMKMQLAKWEQMRQRVWRIWFENWIWRSVTRHRARLAIYLHTLPLCFPICRFPDYP